MFNTLKISQYYNLNYEASQEELNQIHNTLDNRVEDQNIILFSKQFDIKGESLVNKYLNPKYKNFRYLMITPFIQEQFNLIEKDLENICTLYTFQKEYGLNNYVLTYNNLLNSGHLPNFKHDMFEVKINELYLSPTTEIDFLQKYANTSLTHIIKSHKMRYCFRREGGTYGARDSHIRFNQFLKNELFVLTHIDDTYDYAQEMVNMCCEILNKYQLSYRVLLNSKQDMSHIAHYTYDVEIWSPSKNAYVEVSSCSSTGQYQTMRSNIIFNKSYAKSFNGTCLAMERLIFGLLDNGIILK